MKQGTHIRRDYGGGVVIDALYDRADDKANVLIYLGGRISGTGNGSTYNWYEAQSAVLAMSPMMRRIIEELGKKLAIQVLNAGRKARS